MVRDSVFITGLAGAALLGYLLSKSRPSDNQQPVSYIIYQDGAGPTIKAKNGNNGNIDFQGIDATTVIQNTLDALTNGGTVSIKAGTYNISSEIYVNDNTTIEGEKQNITILKASAGFTKTSTYGTSGAVLLNKKWNEIIYPEGNHDITVRDLTIDGSSITATLGLANSYNILVERNNLTASKGYGGLYLNPNHANHAGNYYILYNHIYNSVVDADLLYGDGLWVTAFDAERVVINGNRIHNNAGRGMILEDDTATRPQQMSVVNNMVYLNGNSGIQMTGAIKTVVSNNIVKNNAGYGIVASQTSDDIVIDSNIVDYNQYSGIKFFTAGNRAGVISNNLVKDNGRTVDATGIWIQSSGVTITGNRIYQTIPATQTYTFLDGGNYNIFTDNNCYLNPNFFNGGTWGANSIVKNNLGFKTENSGSSIGTGTQQTIAHGLVAIPTNITLTQRFSNIANPFISAPSDLTNIYISAANLQQFDWKAEV